MFPGARGGGQNVIIRPFGSAPCVRRYISSQSHNHDMKRITCYKRVALLIYEEAVS